jgi:hypothetical protein
VVSIDKESDASMHSNAGREAIEELETGLTESKALYVNAMSELGSCRSAAIESEKKYGDATKRIRASRVKTKLYGPIMQNFSLRLTICKGSSPNSENNRLGSTQHV